MHGDGFERALCMRPDESGRREDREALELERFHFFLDFALEPQIEETCVGIGTDGGNEHEARHAVFLREAGEHHLVIMVDMVLRRLRARLLLGGAERREQHVAAHEIMPSLWFLKIDDVGAEFRIVDADLTACKGDDAVIARVAQERGEQIATDSAGRADDDSLHGGSSSLYGSRQGIT